MGVSFRETQNTETETHNHNIEQKGLINNINNFDFSTLGGLAEYINHNE
jgi:hypothetical protein